MSMLIIGVNPPKSCYSCSWYNKVDCPVNDGRYYYRVQRHPSCPLVEVSESLFSAENARKFLKENPPKEGSET